MRPLGYVICCALVALTVGCEPEDEPRGQETASKSASPAPAATRAQYRPVAASHEGEGAKTSQRSTPQVSWKTTRRKARARLGATQRLGGQDEAGTVMIERKERKVVYARGSCARGLVKVKVRLQRHPKGLLLSYVVRNEGYAPVYLFTPLEVLRQGTYEPSGNRVYTSWKDGALHVSKRVWQTPALFQVNRPEVPYLTRLGAEETFSETIRIPAPVAIRFPYGPTGRAAPDWVARQVVFSLGFVSGDDVSPRPVQEQPGLYRIGYQEAQRAQQVVECAPLEMRVEVAED